MAFNLELSHDLNYYFTVLVVFFGAYWIAYIFKNLSGLMQRQGIIKFVILMVFFFSVAAVLGENVEAVKDYWITGAYFSGFMFRFFRHDN